MPSSNDHNRYKIIVGENKAEILVCFDETVFNASNWMSDPVSSTIPVLFTETMFQLCISSLLFLLFKPLHLPRLAIEIIGGILMGPTLLTRYLKFVQENFPVVSAIVLENFTNFGIIYYMFLVGMEMNLSPMMKIGKRMTTTVLLGMIPPIVVGLLSYFLIIPPLNPQEAVLPKLKGAFLWATVLSATNMPELVEILADLKLLRTEIGRTAVASSFVTDMATWFLLSMVISISSNGYVLRMCISTIILILFSTFFARPILSWLISTTSNARKVRESHVQFILMGVLISAFITDALGLGSFLGPFLFGFSLPSGSLTSNIAERIKKVTAWIMVPLYCLVNGTKSNLIVRAIPKGRSIKHVVMFLAISSATKIITTFVMCLRSNTTRQRDIFALGVLMNSKGLLALIIINVGRNLQIVDIYASTVMVVTIIVMMISVPLFIKFGYKPQRRLMRHKIRTIQNTGSKSTFRIVTFLHSKYQVPGMMSLLQMSNPTPSSKINAVGVHLVELTEHSSAAMLIVHDTYRSKGNDRTRKETGLEPVIEAMEEFSHEYQLISLECLTAISQYTTMHIDVCSIADDKLASFLILPFHEQVNATDESEPLDSHAIRNMNQQVLSNAPCTVGILADHGLGKLKGKEIHVVMFFIGGVDDQEALSYAWRMAWGPNVRLSVVRFVPGENAIEPTPLEDLDESEGILSQLENYSRQRELDDAFIEEFKNMTLDNHLVRYSEEVVNGGEETVAVIRNILEKNNYHLCIVGKGSNRNSPVEYGLLELMEFPELGAIGDAIVTSKFTDSTSVLVMQCYNKSCRRNSKGMGLPW